MDVWLVGSLACWLVGFLGVMGLGEWRYDRIRDRGWDWDR